MPRCSAATVACVRSVTFEAAQDHVDVPLHGGLADPQGIADFLVAAALDDQLQHLQFASAQVGLRRTALPGSFEIEGGMNFEPECTVRIAVARSVCDMAFSR